MAKGKTPRHDRIPIEFFQQLWPTIRYDFHQMIVRVIENEALQERIVKGLISLIPKEGATKGLLALFQKKGTPRT